MKGVSFLPSLLMIDEHLVVVKKRVVVVVC